VARTLMNEQRVPMVVEVMLERVTNIAMRPEIDNITGFAPVLGSIEDRVAAS
jgi:tartronate-semialdehyde synthase